MRVFVLYVLPVFLFLGCELFRDEVMETKEIPLENSEKKEDGRPKKTDNDAYFYSSKVVRGRERVVSRTWLTAEARPGDKLLITIEGWGDIPHFVDSIHPYDEFYKDYIIDYCWNEEEFCLPERASFPNCFARYHAVHKERVGKIEFPDDVLELPLRIEMNGNLYPVGEVVEHTGTKIVTEFLIEEEMINNDLLYTSTYLIKEFPQEKETVMVGFLGFLDERECPKIDKQQARFQPRKHNMTPIIHHFAMVILKQKKRD